MNNVMDRRVVEMQFDNSQFEKGIEQSIKSLDQLDKSLESVGSSEYDLDGITKSVESCSHSLSQIGDVAEYALSSFVKFKILGTSIESITNNIIDSGKKLLKALTIDPITTGFNEYETYINAFQTIMAGTREEFKLNQAFDLTDANDVATKAEREAEQLQTITEALDELNSYADKTIYNFTQMTSSIGKFTSAGVELDTAVSAIEGISNLAALAGADSNANNRAMYNISQALQSGYMLSRDWFSIENAGMATKEFQDLLIKVARKKGKTVDTSKGFRESLSDKWLTNDVLTEALEILGGGLSAQDLANKGWADEKDIDYFLQLGEMANDAATKVKTVNQLVDTLKEAAQSGWTTSWRHIIGDLEEAKEVLTYISNYVGDIINRAADNRNAKLLIWKALGGRDSTINGLKNILQTIDAVVSTAKEGFRTFFPEKTGQDLAKFSKNFESFTERIKNFFINSEGATDNLENISKIFQTFGLGFDIVKNVVGFVWKYLVRISDSLSPIASIVLSFMGFLSDIYSIIIPLFGKTDGELTNLNNGLVIVKSSLQWLSEKLSVFYTNVLSKIQKFADMVKTSGWKEAFNWLWEEIKGVWNSLYAQISSSLPELWKTVKGFLFGTVDADGKQLTEGFFKTIWTSVTAWATTKLPELWKTIKGFLFGTVDADGKQLTDSIFEKIWNWMKNLFNSIDWKNVGMIGLNLLKGFWNGIKAGAKWLWKKVTGIFTSLIDRIKDVLGIHSPSTVMYEIGMWLIEGLENAWKNFNERIIQPIVKFFKDLAQNIKDKVSEIKAMFTNAFSKKDGEDVGMSFFEKIGNGLRIGWSALQSVFVWIKDGLEAAYHGIAEFLTSDETKAIIDNIINIWTSISTIKAINRVSKGFANIGLGVKTMGESFKKISKSADNFVDNYSDFLEETAKNNKKRDTFGTTVLKIAGSIAILAASVWLLSKIDKQDLIKSGIALAGLAVTITIMSALVKKANVSGKDFLGLAGAIAVLSGVVLIISWFSWETIVKGIVAIGALFAEIALFSKFSKSIKTAKGTFIGLSLCIGILAIVVRKLGKMKVDALLKGLAAMAIIALEMSLMTKAFSKTKGSKGMALTMVGIAASMLVLSMAVGKLGKMSVGKLIKGLGALTIIVLILKLLGNSMGKMKTNGMVKTVAVLAIFSIVMISLVAVIKVLKDMNTLDLAALFAGFGVGIAAFANAIAVLGKISLGTVLKGITNLLLITTIGLAAVFGMGKFFEWLDKYTGNSGYMVSLIERTSDVFSALGYLIGRFIGSFGLGFSSTLPEIATNLNGFTTNLGSFPKDIKKFDNGTYEGVKNLSKTIISLFADDVVTAVLDLFSKGNAIDNFGSSVVKMADALVSFRDHLNGGADGTSAPLSSSDISKANNAGKLAAALSDVVENLPNKSKMERKMGVTKAEFFASNMGNLVDGLVTFDSKISNSTFSTGNDEKLKSAASVASSLATLLTAIPLEGGISQWWYGSQDFSSFGDKITNLSGGLESFATMVNDTKFPKLKDGSNVQNAIDIAIALAGFQAELNSAKTTSGISIWTIFGSWSAEYSIPDLGTFGVNLAPFATGLVGFANAFNDVTIPKLTDAANIQNAIEIATSLAEFQTKLNEAKTSSNESVTNVLGQTTSVTFKIPDLGDFAANLPGFADGLAKYGEMLAHWGIGDDGTEIDPSSITQSNSVIAALGSLAKLLADKNIEVAEFDGLNKIVSLDAFANTLPNFAEGLKAYSKNLSGFVNDSGYTDSVGADGEDLKAAEDTLVAMSTFMKVIQDNPNYKLGNELADMSTFNSLFGIFGSALKTYSTNVGGFSTASTPEDRQSAKDTFNDMASLIGTVNLKKKSLSKFNELSTIIADFGTNFGSFSGVMISVGYDMHLITTGMEYAKQAVTDMNEFAKLFDTDDGPLEQFWKWVTGENETGWDHLVDIAESMAEFGDLFRKFSEGISVAKNIDADFASLYEVIGIMADNMANGTDITKMQDNMRAFSEWMYDSGIQGMMDSLQQFYYLLDENEIYRDKDYSIFRTIADLYSAFAKLSSFDQNNIETATQLIHTITQDLVQDINDDFVLRPVVDMTNVNAAASTINSMFGTRTPVASRATMTLHSTSMANANFEFDDTRIVSELQNVRSEISTLKGAIQEVQVVLDTGVIAGAVSPSVYRYVTNQFKSGMRYSGYKPVTLD